LRWGSVLSFNSLRCVTQSEVCKQKVLGKLCDKLSVLGELSFSLSARLVRVTDHIPCTSVCMGSVCFATFLSVSFNSLSSESSSSTCQRPCLFVSGKITTNLP
jgi:hypothetical protein